ncbi:MAG: phosphomethylpyrimidine synthase [Spirochaetes bacterium GWF1_41_5]|nr:MAG: phosphomethylpyrimidine synthase [Spirochaetes bacterium GWF1_41_5]HBE02865.1 phosphomethylpyrimidine synthase [Spirochaetia bacterium]
MSIINDLKKGIIPGHLKQAAQYENLESSVLAKGIIDGTICLPQNRVRKLVFPRAVGAGLSVKINANIGSSPYDMSIENERAKLAAALSAGADAVMDLSLGSLQNEIRRMVLAESSVMVGTVPLYQTAFELSRSSRSFSDMTINDFLAVIRAQAAEGVDFMTIHSGITMSSLERMEKQGRLLNVVSRGGSMLVEWIKKNKKESPLYEYFDEICAILAEYDVTISLGDGMRPGAVLDATDHAQIDELITLGALAGRARDMGLQVIIEGPGHMPLNQIEANILLEKKLCAGAPFYVLGPLVTDIAPGYDHITCAIGGALAAWAGADFLCYVTPSEHLKLPSVDDVRDGVIAAKIAAQAADLARGNKKALEKEKHMANARRSLDWEKQIALSVNPDKARRYRLDSKLGKNDKICTMCGEFCAIDRLNALEEPGKK